MIDPNEYAKKVDEAERLSKENWQLQSDLSAKDAELKLHAARQLCATNNAKHYADECVALEEQLSAAQARVEELEAPVRALVESANKVTDVGNVYALSELNAAYHMAVKALEQPEGGD